MHIFQFYLFIHQFLLLFCFIPAQSKINKNIKGVNSMIKQLPQQVTLELSAQQVISSLPDCIKQLVENSIDAGASKINVYIQDYGRKNIEVSDNGCGISDFSFLGQKGSTSKNTGDTIIKSLGFRGQALNSIGRISGSMIFQSKTIQKDAVSFDIKSKQISSCPNYMKNGSKVRIQQLFKYLPVRREQLRLKHKQFLKRTVQILKEYCMIYPEISFTFTNNREGKNQSLIQTTSHKENTFKTWKSRIQEILGHKICQCLVYIKQKHFHGYFLNKIESGSSRENVFIKNQLTFMYLNRRPIDKQFPITQLLDGFYKKYNNKTKYVAIIDLKLQEKDIDINLTPNKREIMIRKQCLSEILDEMRSAIQANVIQQIPKYDDYQARKSQKLNKSQSKNKEYKANQQQQIVQNKNNFRTSILYKNNISNDKKLLQESEKPTVSKINTDLKGSILASLQAKMGQKQTKPKINIYPPQDNSKKVQVPQQNIGNLKQQIKDKQSENERVEESISKQKIKVQKLQIQQQFQQVEFKLKKQAFIIQQEDLSMKFSINKENFSDFQILGQFNNGFITCSFKESFFLIDQHASSEKDKFQQLLQQKPKFIGSDESIIVDPLIRQSIVDHSKSLKQDGYQFYFASDSKIEFTRYPVFLNQKFGSDIFLELAEKKMRLKQLDQVRNIAATKACRSAVMIGKILSKQQMKGLVSKLSELQSPWNCPHGRPTLIQLGQIQKAVNKIKINKQYTF